MAGGTAGIDLPGQLETLFAVGQLGHLSDGQLLRLSLAPGDPATRPAFAALIERHGPMVAAVCRRALDDPHDADDAFQATFLVLANRARSVRKVESLASWLHGVALRVSSRIRSNDARRRVHERRWATRRASDGREGSSGSWPELHEEIDRLPEKYREPLILCHLEGLTADEAARRLGCPRGTILSRLSRARERLRARMARHGHPPAQGLFAGVGHASPAVPRALLGLASRSAARVLAGSPIAEVAPAPLAALTKGALQAMLRAKLKTAGLAALASAVLAIGVGSASARRGPAAGTPIAPPQDPPAAKAANPPRIAGTADAIFAPLPARGELHQVLRRVSAEAVAVARTAPRPSARTIVAIASAQAKAGDLDGARATFHEAAREAGGDFGGVASAWNLWFIAHSQAESGLKDEARATLRASLKVLPDVEGDFNRDSQTLRTLSAIAREQSGIGERDEARKSVDRLVVFAETLFVTSKIGNAREANAPEIAEALAAVGDFDAAFRWSEVVQNGGMIAGQIAKAASSSLDREEALRFIREAAGRLARLETVDQTYFGLGDLAEAQARLGDWDAAGRSARAIGEGPSRVAYDMTDGQPYALLRVANLRREAGDLAGAAETLRDGFRSVRDHPKMRGRDGRYAQVAGSQVALGDLDGARRTAAAMEAQNAEILANLARAEAAAGDNEVARATFARAIAEAGLSILDVDRPGPEAPRKPGINPSLTASERMKLAEIRSMAGDIPGALEAFRSIQDPAYRGTTLTRIVAARATVGDVAGALQLGLDASETPAERQAAFQGVGEGVTLRLTLRSLAPRAE